MKFAEEDDDDVTLEYTKIKVESKKATLFKIDGEEIWLPHSQIVSIDKEEKTVVITAWIAGEKGLC